MLLLKDVITNIASCINVSILRNNIVLCNEISSKVCWVRMDLVWNIVSLSGRMMAYVLSSSVEWRETQVRYPFDSLLLDLLVHVLLEIILWTANTRTHNPHTRFTHIHLSFLISHPSYSLVQTSCYNGTTLFFKIVMYSPRIYFSIELNHQFQKLNLNISTQNVLIIHRVSELSIFKRI